MPLPRALEQEQALLARLHDSGDPAASAAASNLTRLFHDREMALLAADVYDAAKHEGEPPPGWTRASKHLGTLRDYDPSLTQQDVNIIGSDLAPSKSGFRAEIYLPNPGLQSLGYRPVVVFKGSAGQVMTERGLRDTTAEDYFANNFPQSIGMETDYYDRAMRLSVNLKSQGLSFDLAGHSLGGGMASAAAAVTGEPTTTFNAAGLNPETPRRFAQQNPHIKLHDVNHLINAYEVQGDLLTQGIQGTIHDMDGVRRGEVGSVLQEVSRLATNLPEGRELLQQKLDPELPLWAQPKAAAFIERVADTNVDEMLHSLPQTAGQVHRLPAMMKLDGRLVARPDDMPLSQIMARTGPVWELLDAAASGAHFGEVSGAEIAVVGRDAHHLLHGAGDLACGAGKAVGGWVKDEQLAEGKVLLKIERVVGFGDAARKRTEQFEGLVADLDRDIVAVPACTIGGGWNAEGSLVEGATKHAPEAGAVIGAGAFVTADAGAQGSNPVDAWQLARAVDTTGRVRSSAAEALDRHSMRETVLPSLDARIEHVEQHARGILRRDARQQTALTPMQAGHDLGAQGSGTTSSRACARQPGATTPQECVASNKPRCNRCRYKRGWNTAIGFWHGNRKCNARPNSNR